MPWLSFPDVKMLQFLSVFPVFPLTYIPLARSPVVVILLPWQSKILLLKFNGLPMHVVEEEISVVNFTISHEASLSFISQSLHELHVHSPEDRGAV